MIKPPVSELGWAIAGVLVVFVVAAVSKRAAGVVLLAITAGGLFSAHEKGLI